MTRPSKTTMTSLMCTACNIAIATADVSYAQRLDAMRMHDHECWSHGQARYLDGKQFKNCVHEGACYRTVPAGEAWQ